MFFCPGSSLCEEDSDTKVKRCPVCIGLGHPRIIGSETFPSECYILFNEYNTSNGDKNTMAQSRVQNGNLSYMYRFHLPTNGHSIVGKVE